MIPRNCFIRDGECLWFDQEWTLDNVPSMFILYRGMLEVYARFSIIKNAVPMEEWLKHYGIDNHLEVFSSLDELFSEMILDKYYVGVTKKNRDGSIYKRNIIRLLS